MSIELSDFDLDRMNVDSYEIIQKSSRGANQSSAFAETILRSFEGLSSDRIYSMKTSVGGGVSADRDKDGSSEITVEAHISSESNDGNASFEGSGEVSVDNQGNVSGGVSVSFDYEF